MDFPSCLDEVRGALLLGVVVVAAGGLRSAPAEADVEAAELEQEEDQEDEEECVEAVGRRRMQNVEKKKASGCPLSSCVCVWVSGGQALGVRD